MRFNQRSFTGGELKPSLWARSDVQKYGVGCKKLRNMVVQAGGGIVNRAGLRYIAKLKYDDKAARIIEFQFSTQQAYALIFQHQCMWVVRNGGLVLNANKPVVAVTNANPAVFTVTAHGWAVGTVLYGDGLNGMTQLNKRFYIVNSVPTADTFTLTDQFGTEVDTSALGAYTTDGRFASIYELALPYSDTELAALKVTQSADVMTIAHPSYAPRELTRTGHAAWSISTPTFAPTQVAPTGVTATAGAGTPITGSTATLQYVVTAVSATGEESLASTAWTTTTAKLYWAATEYVNVSWTAASGAVKYNVYKNRNGFFGYIGSADSTSFVDDNIEPTVGDTPPAARDPFASSNYPATVSLHNQRRFFAQTPNGPDTFYSSQTANYKNFSTSSPAKDNDALTFTLASEQVNAIKDLLSFGDLIAFTSNAEWKISGTQGAALSPSTLNATKQSGRGIADVRPLMVGDTALYVQARGKKVRDLAYRIDSDKYTGNDLSIMSSHLFRKTSTVDKRIKEWCYQQEPDSVVWSVHKDGSFTAFTYQREHDVWAWASQDTDGLLLSTGCVPEDDVDAVYFIAERTVGGVARRMLERMENRDIDEDSLDYQFFVDSGTEFTANSQVTIYGLSHLNGVTVRILADGRDIPDQTVVNGTVTLDQVYTHVIIGRGYDSDIQPVGIDLDLQSGSTKGKPKSIKKVFVQVYNSRHLKAGPSFDKLTPYKNRDFGESLASSLELKSRIIELPILADWDRDASVCIRHDRPTSFAILSLTAEVEI